MRVLGKYKAAFTFRDRQTGLLVTQGTELVALAPNPYPALWFMGVLRDGEWVQVRALRANLVEVSPEPADGPPYSLTQERAAQIIRESIARLSASSDEMW